MTEGLLFIVQNSWPPLAAEIIYYLEFEKVLLFRKYRCPFHIHTQYNDKKHTYQTKMNLWTNYKASYCHPNEEKCDNRIPNRKKY